MTTPCTHPQRLGSMCCVCGAIVGPEKSDATARVAVRGAGTSKASLRVTGAEASVLAAQRSRQLEGKRQLQLVLDLDHTLLECSTDPRAAALAAAPGSRVRALGAVAGRPHWVRLRPRLEEFFAAVAPLYELAIYTHGSRQYAEAVRAALEAEVAGLSFGGRVVSRDCCPDLRGEKSLERLFPGGAARALILDDRLDVWTRGEDQTPRVLVVQPYTYFGKVLANPAHADGDSQLSHSARALVAAHAAFYAGGDASGDAVACLDAARGAVFAGCVFSFSPPADAWTARLAERYGAALAGAAADATHVVATKAPPGHGADNVVHLDWFWYCVWRCRREPDRKYRLAPDPAPPPPPPRPPSPGGDAGPRKRPRRESAESASLSGSGSDSDDAAWADDLEAELGL